jgi:hypothetical protein
VRVSTVANDLTTATYIVTGTAGTMMAAFAWILTYFWYVIVTNLNDATPFSLQTQTIHSLNLNLAMGFGVQVMAQYETQGV